MNSSRTLLVAKIRELAAAAESINEMAAASVLCALAGSLCCNAEYHLANLACDHAQSMIDSFQPKEEWPDTLEA